MRQLLRKAVSEWQRCRGFQFRTRRRKLSCQNANTRAGFCGRPAGTAPDCGAAKPVSFARDADSRFASRQMLSRFVLVAPLVFAYCALIYKWGERSDLPAQFSSRVYSLVFCPPYALSSRAAPFTYPSNGGMGAPPPWLRMALALLLRDSEAPPDFSRTKKSGADAPLLRCPYCEGQGTHPHVCPWPLAFQFIALAA